MKNKYIKKIIPIFIVSIFLCVGCESKSSHNYMTNQQSKASENKNHQLETKEDKDADNKIKELTKSSQEHYSVKEYEVAIKDIDSALELIGDKEDYKLQKETLESLKEDCNSALSEANINHHDEAQGDNSNKNNDSYHEDDIHHEEYVQLSNSTTDSISESQAISIIEDYFINELGYAPNSIDVYEIVDNKYHINVNNYDENGTRATFGWWYVDMSTGEVSR